MCRVTRNLFGGMKRVLWVITQDQHTGPRTQAAGTGTGHVVTAPIPCPYQLKFSKSLSISVFGLSVCSICFFLGHIIFPAFPPTLFFFPFLENTLVGPAILLSLHAMSYLLTETRNIYWSEDLLEKPLLPHPQLYNSHTIPFPNAVMEPWRIEAKSSFCCTNT